MRSELLPGVAIASISLLTACGGGDAGTTGPAGDAAGTAGARAAAATEQEATTKQDATLCALLTPEEIAAAFGGTIRAAVSSDRERVCEYSIPGHEGQILLQRMEARTYEERKDMYTKGSYGVKPTTVEGLGQDAYLMGDAQIEVRVSDEDAISVGVMLFAVGEVPFTPEQARSAVIELAGKAAGRL